MKRLRVLVLMDEALVPPDTTDGLSDKQIAPFKTEYDVVASLEELGHQVQPLGVSDDLGIVRAVLRDWRPDIVFNLLEEFGGHELYVPYVMGYVELMRYAYTGCNPRGLLFATSKALQKKILRYHRIPVPEFAVFARDKTIRRPRRLGFPLIVKSVTVHGSVSISQASVVYDDEKLLERIKFVHRELQSDAIAEQYIDGRELYVGVIGNQRLQTFPIWEMLFENVPEGRPRIATERVKWDKSYQEKVGLKTQAAMDLPDGLDAKIAHLCKRAYRALGQTGYARIDLRLAPDGGVFLIESNPNPQLAHGEDYSESAHAGGLPYNKLVQRIINLGLDEHHQDPRPV